MEYSNFYIIDTATGKPVACANTAEEAQAIADRYFTIEASVVSIDTICEKMVEDVAFDPIWFAFITRQTAFGASGMVNVQKEGI